MIPPVMKVFDCDKKKKIIHQIKSQTGKKMKEYTPYKHYIHIKQYLFIFFKKKKLKKQNKWGINLYVSNYNDKIDIQSINGREYTRFL